MGIAPLFAKIITLPAIDITALRSVFAAAALAIFLMIDGTKLSITSIKEYGVFFLTGLFLAIHWVTFFHSIQVSTVAVTMIAFFTFPVITVFLEPLFIAGAKVTMRDILITLGILMGIVLLAYTGDQQTHTIAGITWGVFSAFCFSMRNILIKRYISHYPGSMTMFYQILITALLLAPFMDLSPSNFQIDTVIYLILLGIVFTALAHTLLVRSLKHLQAKTVSIVFGLQPVVGISVGAVLIHEIPHWMTLLGGVLIVSLALYETQLSS